MADRDPNLTQSLVRKRSTDGTVRELELQVTGGPSAGLSYGSASETIRVGSHPRCDLVIDDPTVSRFHCEIELDAEGARITDLDSRNGTLIDGVAVLRAPLADGARLRIGRTRIEVVLGAKRRQLEVSATASFGAMFGDSVAMRTLFARLAKAAASDATVLIEGETGTGKTLAARSLHAEGARAGNAFVVVDCGAVPPNLLESELFGHERGAFTGAIDTRIGALEEADGGTLFLDEIGELPPALQPKLLGALESRVIRRVGGSKELSIDVRVIAATNRNLRAEVNSGQFRSDLYYRLAVIELSIPPLRERAGDIGALARQVLASLDASPQQIESLLDDELVARLENGAWPGNVRELRNYLERCLVLDEIAPVPGGGAAPRGAGGDYTNLPYADAKKRAMRDFERRYVTALLERHDKVSAAAEAAEIDRTYFYRLLRRSGINRS
jgi:DNA-binding NtrC family response regulator